MKSPFSSLQLWRTALLLSLVLGGCVQAPLTPVAVPAAAFQGVSAPQEPAPTPTRDLVFAVAPSLNRSLIASASPPLAAPIASPTATATPRATRRIDTTLNILVLGTDRRSVKQKAWRTDTIMIIMVDRPRQEVAVVSIPRDTWVTIPGFGKQRLNIVDFLGEAKIVKVKGGGPALEKTVFWENFRVRVDHYVRVDLEGFAQIVDILGGVDVEITCPRTVAWKNKTIHFAKGVQHLSGEEVMAYVRARMRSSDIDRARRQQRVLLAMRDRAQELNLLPRLPALYKALQEHVQTDLTLMDMLDLARLGMSIQPERVHSRVISFPLVRNAVTSRGEQVLIPDLAAIRKVIAQAFEQPPLLEATSKGINCERE